MIELIEGALRGASDRGRALAYWLMTSRADISLPGLFLLRSSDVARRLAWDDADAVLAELVTARFIEVDDVRGIIWMTDATRVFEDATKSLKNLRAWGAAWPRIPDCPLRLQAWQMWRATIQIKRGGRHVAELDRACPMPTGTALRLVPPPDDASSLPLFGDTEATAPASAASTASAAVLAFEEEGARIDEVVSYWCERWKQRTGRVSRPGREAREKVRDRLKEGFQPSELRRAIDGMHASRFHWGQNGETIQARLELAMRDSGQVERLAATADDSDSGRAAQRVEVETVLKGRTPSDRLQASRMRDAYRARSGAVQVAVSARDELEAELFFGGGG